MATQTLEDRLSVVEQELARLKQRIDADNLQPAPTGWDQIFGIFADDPLFEEAVRLGREWRDAQNTINNEEADAPA